MCSVSFCITVRFLRLFGDLRRCIQSWGYATVHPACMFFPRTFMLSDNTRKQCPLPSSYSSSEPIRLSTPHWDPPWNHRRLPGCQHWAVFALRVARPAQRAWDQRPQSSHCTIRAPSLAPAPQAQFTSWHSRLSSALTKSEHRSYRLSETVTWCSALCITPFCLDCLTHVTIPNPYPRWTLTANRDPYDLTDDDQLPNGDF